jgi:hypothetical protein
MMMLKGQAPAMTSRQRLLHALARRSGGGKGASRYAALGALPPYGETRVADAEPGHGARPNDFGAFQSDAFQGDAYQVEVF